METVWPAVRVLELLIPSKFVLGDPVDNCTVMGVVRAKKEGNDCMEKVFGGATLATVPVTRVNRRYRESALAFAKVESEPAVKAVMCAATVCPGARTEVSVPPLKAFAGATKPLVSTTKGFWGLPTSVTFTAAPKDRLLLMALPEVANTASFVTTENCVDEEGMAVTTPSIQSPAVVDNGSYSSSVKVPSELRTMSRLATCPCTTQEANVRLRLKAVQLGEKTVEEFATAVSEPRVAVFTVTD